MQCWTGKWFLQTEYHFVNSTSNYTQTLRIITSSVKQGKRLFKKQDKNFDL